MTAAATAIHAAGDLLSTERKEFALIQLISDETERQQALDQLNAKYNSDRLAAAQQYQTPFHLYDEGGIRRTARAISFALGQPVSS